MQEKKLCLPIRAAVTGRLQETELDRIFSLPSSTSLRTRLDRALALV